MASMVIIPSAIRRDSVTERLVYLLIIVAIMSLPSVEEPCVKTSPIKSQPKHRQI